MIDDSSRMTSPSKPPRTEQRAASTCALADRSAGCAGGSSPGEPTVAEPAEHDEQWWVRSVEQWMSAQLRRFCSAEDVVQGARIKLLEQGVTAIGGGYFFTVLRHFVIDRNRWARAACRDPGRVRPLDAFAEVPDVGAFERIERRDCVRNMLDSLAPEARYLLRAKAVDGETWSEISRHLGICKDTARLRYRRLTERLSIEHAALN